MECRTPLQQDAAEVRQGITDGATARRYAAAWRGAPQRRDMSAVKAFGGAPIAELAGGEEEKTFGAGGEEEKTFGAGPCQVRDALWLGICRYFNVRLGQLGARTACLRCSNMDPSRVWPSRLLARTSAPLQCCKAVGMLVVKPRENTHGCRSHSLDTACIGRFYWSTCPLPDFSALMPACKPGWFWLKMRPARERLSALDNFTRGELAVCMPTL